MVRWVRGYRDGKFAALEHDALFTAFDGAELCRMGVGSVLLMDRPDNVLVAYASVITALQALAPRESSCGEPSLLFYAVLCRAVPCCAVLCCAALRCAAITPLMSCCLRRWLCFHHRLPYRVPYDTA